MLLIIMNILLIAKTHNFNVVYNNLSIAHDNEHDLWRLFTYFAVIHLAVDKISKIYTKITREMSNGGVFIV